MKKQIIMGLSALTLLTGCLTKELPSYSVYSLKLDPMPMSTTVFYDKSVYIKQPKALNSLKSKNIVYTNGLSFENYALSLWSNEPSKMIQQLSTNYLSKLNQYKYVTSSKLAQITDYTLYSELLSFEHDLKASQTAFSIRVYLKNNNNETIVAKNFSYKEKLKSNDAQSAVKALNMSVNKFVQELNGFIQKSL